VTAIVWDQVSERIYQAGVDRGVLYLHDGTVAPWNGLINVEESSDSELKSFYLDGVKFLQNLIPGDFQGKIKAFTYPDEFEAVNGIANPATGIYYHNQPAKSFNLAYRTKIGNDVDGTDHGYRIHILYNIMAVPDSIGFETFKESNTQPVEFSWNLSGTPTNIHNLRPTVHISMDSTKTPPPIMKMLEDMLYGTVDKDPYLPSMAEVSKIFGFKGALVIVDNGDGTWSAVDESDTYITMIDPTTFQIDNADVTYLDEVTYTISSTNYDFNEGEE
jgi:hypothetical protein